MPQASRLKGLLAWRENEVFSYLWKMHSAVLQPHIGPLQQLQLLKKVQKHSAFTLLQLCWVTLNSPPHPKAT